MAIIYGDSFNSIGSENGLAEHYMNPNQFQDMTSQLHCCETLFGDFDAKLMILLQDAADEATVEKQKKAYPRNPLRHGIKVPTNRKLIKLLTPYYPSIGIEGENASNCGVYYANAVWLIKKGAGMSAPIVSPREVLDECKPVMDATISNMKNLELVIAFGKHAFNSLKWRYGITENWDECLESCKVISVQESLDTEIKIATLNHPRASVKSSLTQDRLAKIFRNASFNP